MLDRICSWSLTPLLLIAGAACGGSDGAPTDVPPVGSAASSLLEPNALNPNALNPNALNPNALNPNALNPNALNVSEGSLAPNKTSAVQPSGDDGELSRQLLSYLVSCALDQTQSLRFSWTDAVGATHNEVYWGLMGLAQSWLEEPLSTSQQQWVSACIASRVNWYGISVVISARGSNQAIKAPSALERASYAMEEGAFWGNLFSDPPALHACHHAPNDAHSRLQLRDCAAGHLTPQGGAAECGIIKLVGTCDARCNPLHPNGLYHPSCTDDAGVQSSKVITTFLP